MKIKNKRSALPETPFVFISGKLISNARWLIPKTPNIKDVGKIHIDLIISFVSPVKTSKKGIIMNIKTGMKIKNNV